MPDATTTSPTATPRLVATHAGARTGALPLFLSVLLTYPRRPFLWCWPVGNAILCALFSSHVPTTYDARSTGLTRAEPLPFDGVFLSSFLLSCAVGFLAASVTGHFIQLLRSPRGQVVPRLRRTALAANIFLTVAIVLGVAAIWPHPGITLETRPTLATHTQRVPVHALALVSVVAAQLAWTQFAPVTGFASILTWAVLALPQGRDVTVRMLLGQAPALECATALFGVGLFVGLWAVIARSRDRKFEIDPIVEALRRKLIGDDSTAPVPAPAPPPGTIPALAAPRTLTASSRLRLHRVAAAGGSRPGVAGLVVGLALVVLVYSLRAFGVEQMDATTPGALVYMVSIVPTIVALASAMENRGPLITRGLLLPQRRREFVRDVGLAMLANLFTTWIAAVLPIFLLIAFDVPEPVRPAPAALASMLAIAAAYQVFALGAVAWLLRLNDRIVITIVQSAVCASGIPIIAVGAGRTPLPVTLAITVAFALGGLALAHAAYRRWTTSEPPNGSPSKTAAAL